MKHYLLLIIALLLLVLPSCDKKQKGTFTIKGQLLQDCGGNPVVGRRISVRERIQLGHGTVEIGSATTDDNGYFELVAGYYGSEPKEVQGLPGEYETPRMPKSGQTIDLGTIYAYFLNSVIIKLKVSIGAVSSNDTLFFQDISGRGRETIFPIPLGENYYTFSFNYDNSSGELMNAGNNINYIFYNVGTDPLNQLKVVNEGFHVNFCGQSKDTVTITLP